MWPQEGNVTVTSGGPVPGMTTKDQCGASGLTGSMWQVHRLHWDRENDTYLHWLKDHQETCRLHVTQSLWTMITLSSFTRPRVGLNLSAVYSATQRLSEHLVKHVLTRDLRESSQKKEREIGQHHKEVEHCNPSLLTPSNSLMWQTAPNLIHYSLIILPIKHWAAQTSNQRLQCF